MGEQGDGVGSDAEDGGAAPLDNEGREKSGRSQPISCAAVVKEPKAAKYWTGLSMPAFRWVLQALQDAVRTLWFWRVCCPVQREHSGGP